MYELELRMIQVIGANAARTRAAFFGRSTDRSRFGLLAGKARRLGNENALVENRLGW
jgi:hypothetical protein